MLRPLILLVDDFPDALEMYETYLTLSGHRVITATNGAEAIAAARNERPTLIFMDIVMSDMSGIDAMRAIRADSMCNRMPIVALTARAVLREHREALDSGFDAVMLKPCLPDELARVAARWLDAEATT